MNESPTMMSDLTPALTWLGKGARPYLDAQGAPGTYYVPSKHPYQATLADGIQVQEAYPGQYYLQHPVSGLGSALGAFQKLQYPRWICAVVGAVVGAGAGYGGAYYYGKKKMPPLPPTKKKKLPQQVAIGTAIGGAIIGWLLCGPQQDGTVTPLPPPPPPPAQLTPPGDLLTQIR